MQLPLRAARPLATALVSMSLLAACGNEERSGDEVAQDISAELRSAPHDLDEEMADCYADELVAEVGVERLEEVDFSAEEPEELGEAIAAAMITAVDECGAPSPSSEEQVEQ